MSLHLFSYSDLNEQQKKVVDFVIKSFEGQPVTEAEKIISVIRQKVDELSVVKVTEPLTAKVSPVPRE